MTSISRATWPNLLPSNEELMIVGIGVDICQIDRVEAMLQRHPPMLDRLFTSAESHTADGKERTSASLAARFSAKEALAKALGSPGGMSWLDAEVTISANGAPAFDIRGSVAARAEECGVHGIRLSLSHDGLYATAFVICEGKS